MAYTANVFYTRLIEKQLFAYRKLMGKNLRTKTSSFTQSNNYCALIETLLSPVEEDCAVLLIH